MPRITADGPDDPSLDEIKTIDLSDTDIAAMSDEQLENHIRMLRGNREIIAKHRSTSTKTKTTTKVTKTNIAVDDSSDDFV